MTYSIVARCPRTGQLGVAVQSHFFSVGGVVPWAEAGVGAVATQATAEVAHGPDGLTEMRAGRSAEEALRSVLATDAHAETRQVGMVDAHGRTAVHTGSSCIAHAGHLTGDGFTVQANMMDGPAVPGAMAEAFTAAIGDDLVARLLAALDAAQAAGGDIRGQQSAAILVVHAASPRPGHDRVVDLRVEDHPEPLTELRRLVGLGQAYRSMDDAEDAMNRGDLEAALAIFERSVASQPEQVEFPFWRAVLLAGLGQVVEARAAAAPVFARPNGDRWRELVRRLPAAGSLSAEGAAALLDEEP